MTSEVDKTIPADNVKVSKSDMRDQFTTIYNEITALQARTSVAGAKAFYGFVDQLDLHAEVVRVHNLQPGNLAEDMAYGRVALNAL